MAQGKKCVAVNVTSCEFDPYLRKWNIDNKQCLQISAKNEERRVLTLHFPMPDVLLAWYSVKLIKKIIKNNMWNSLCEYNANKILEIKSTINVKLRFTVKRKYHHWEGIFVGNVSHNDIDYEWYSVCRYITYKRTLYDSFILSLILISSVFFRFHINKGEIEEMQV